MDLIAVSRQSSGLPAVDLPTVARALAEADDAATVRRIESDLERAENLMRSSGLYEVEEIRPVNELRMRARWKLGRLLAEMDRASGPGRGKKISQTGKSFLAYLKQIALDKNRAMEAQRIGALPEEELEKAFAYVHKLSILCTFAALIERARPWWYQASRKKKHKIIAARAKLASDVLGPFPLIYADPPWKFETYSEKGLERTPDQHYPTLTLDEIKNFQVAGRGVATIASKDAALLLWCTSANMKHALEVMSAWGFTYKTNAVWVKTRDDGVTPIGGTGLVFRNMHELLLYGIRGAMPGPQYQPPSVFVYPRGEHSAKPPEIRVEIEKMYPDFDRETRLELFARETVSGWTSYGFEADRDAAE